MPEMEVVPYERFGPVWFGATKQQVIDAIGHPDTVDSWSGKLVLHYRQLRVHVTIDEDDSCESVESVEPSVCVPIVDGDLRLAGDVYRLVEALHQRGIETRQTPDSTNILCDELGVNMWRESADSREIDSVCAFRNDTYQLMLVEVARSL